MARFAFILLGVMSVAACAATDSGPVVSDARIGEPTGPNAALYLTATGEDADRLVGARTDAASRIEVHETVSHDDGTMGMERVEGVDLRAGGSVILEPGGLHLMLVDVEALQVGETVEVTLVWETAGEMTIEAEVVEPQATMGDDGTGAGLHGVRSMLDDGHLVMPHEPSARYVQ